MGLKKKIAAISEAHRVFSELPADEESLGVHSKRPDTHGQLQLDYPTEEVIFLSRPSSMTDALFPRTHDQNSKVSHKRHVSRLVKDFLNLTDNVTEPSPAVTRRSSAVRVSMQSHLQALPTSFRVASTHYSHREYRFARGLVRVVVDDQQRR